MAISSARDAILGRLRLAQRTGRLPVVEDEVLVPAPGARTADEVLGRFLGELAALGVEPHLETSEEAVRARVASIVANDRVFAWDGAWLPYGIDAVLANAVRGSSTRAEQASAEVGVTGCDAAIAETGSLVLLAGEGRPRAASLLPPVHVAVVRRADLRWSMGEYFRDRADAIVSASSCMVITGPSRTADIELTLTVGVHGPGTVIVVVGP